MADPKDIDREFWTTLAEGLDELSPRLEALERQRGLTPLHLTRTVKGLEPKERTDATIALVRWRVERLEAFYRLN